MRPRYNPGQQQQQQNPPPNNYSQQGPVNHLIILTKMVLLPMASRAAGPPGPKTFSPRNLPPPSTSSAPPIQNTWPQTAAFSTAFGNLSM